MFQTNYFINNISIYNIILFISIIGTSYLILIEKLENMNVITIKSIVKKRECHIAIL